MATRKQSATTATTKDTARKELTALLHGLSQLFPAVETEIWEGKYQSAITTEERKDVHQACEDCLDALTTVTLLPPPPEVGQRILHNFQEAMAGVGDNV